MSDAVVVWDGERIEVFLFPTKTGCSPFDSEAHCGSQDDALWLWRARRFERIALHGLPQVSWGFGCRDGSELVRVRGGLCRLTDAGPVWIPRAATMRWSAASGLGPSGSRTISSVSPPWSVGCSCSPRTVRSFASSTARTGSVAGVLRALPDDENGLWVATSRAVVRLDAQDLASRFDAKNGWAEAR